MADALVYDAVTAGRKARNAVSVEPPGDLSVGDAGEGAPDVPVPFTGLLRSYTQDEYDAIGTPNANTQVAYTGTAATAGAVPTSAKGAERWRPVVLEVLAELGQPAALADGVVRRIAFESGGNATAINKTDSNARAGHPSQGLMQTIPGTFARYAGKYVSAGITDARASIYAGLNYAIHRYGSIAAIDPRVRPKGY